MAEAKAPPPVGIKQRFVEFAKCGDRAAAPSGHAITLPSIVKWFQQAKVYGQSLTVAETEVAFRKFNLDKMDRKVFLQFLADVCQSKRLDVARITAKLTGCGKPHVAENPINKSSTSAGSASRSLKLNITDWLMSSPKFNETLTRSTRNRK